MSELTIIILQAIVETAARAPTLRGPYIFDEETLQAHASKARSLIRAISRPERKQQ